MTKQDYKELGDECFKHLEETNPNGGIKEFIRIAVEFGYKRAVKKLTIPVVVSSKAINYKKAFGLAMNYINESPCDPDITSKQLDAWIDLKHFLDSNKDK